MFPKIFWQIVINGLNTDIGKIGGQVFLDIINLIGGCSYDISYSLIFSRNNLKGKTLLFTQQFIQYGLFLDESVKGREKLSCSICRLFSTRGWGYLQKNRHFLN